MNLLSSCLIQGSMPPFLKSWLLPDSFYFSNWIELNEDLRYAVKTKVNTWLTLSICESLLLVCSGLLVRAMLECRGGQALPLESSGGSSGLRQQGDHYHTVCSMSLKLVICPQAQWRMVSCHLAWRVPSPVGSLVCWCSWVLEQLRVQMGNKNSFLKREDGIGKLGDFNWLPFSFLPTVSICL